MANYDNNFSKFKDSFMADTKLDADTNMQLYIAYYNARMADINWQASVKVLFELEQLNKKK